MEITTISKFTEELTKLSTDNDYQLYFRGHSDHIKYKLVPSLYREEDPFYEFEDKVFKETMINCPSDFSNCKNTLEILVKMQHYGIPTRILDLTRNALVALYFCCVGSASEDGEVLILRIPKNKICDYNSDKVTVLSNIAKVSNDKIEYSIPQNFDENNRVEIESFNDKYLGYLLHEIKEDKPQFFNIINPNDINKVYAVNVKLDNPRIIRQNGAFLIFGIDNNKKSFPKVQDDWIVKINDEKIIIPKTSKQQLLKELEILGISKSTIFPELDDYADYLKKKYRS